MTPTLFFAFLFDFLTKSPLAFDFAFCLFFDKTGGIRSLFYFAFWIFDKTSFCLWFCFFAFLTKRVVSALLPLMVNTHPWDQIPPVWSFKSKCWTPLLAREILFDLNKTESAHFVWKDQVFILQKIIQITLHHINTFCISKDSYFLAISGCLNGIYIGKRILLKTPG